MIYIVNNVDNVDNVDTTTLNNNSNSIILLSSNSFTLSTKVKRAYASMNGVSTIEDGCPCFCHYIGIANEISSIYTSSLKLSSSIKSLIQENSTSAFLVNVSFLAEPTGSYENTFDRVCISGFYSYAGDTTTQTISNNSHQLAVTFGLDNDTATDIKYVNFYESFITWENIQDIDMYGIQCVRKLTFTLTRGIFYFADPVYYRLEMIVYEE